MSEQIPRNCEGCRHFWHSKDWHAWTCNAIGSTSAEIADPEVLAAVEALEIGLEEAALALSRLGACPWREEEA